MKPHRARIAPGPKLFIVIYVGTCGFSYKDWIGPFYPYGTRPQAMLAHYAREFCAVEIDSSYYGVPSPQSVRSMAARTPDAFRFSFKVPQTVTHAPDPGAPVHDDAIAFRESVEPMREAGKLACALVQFPNAFKPGELESERLRRIARALAGVPLVVEFRNRLWQQPATLALLRELGAGYVNADMPKLEGLLQPSADVTSSVGYVRFHGRNAKQWWRGSNVTRYDYAYDAGELTPWIDRIADVDAVAEETYVFFNNHANGRAAHDAASLSVLLGDRYGRHARSAVARPPHGLPRQSALPGMEPG